MQDKSLREQAASSTPRGKKKRKEKVTVVYNRFDSQKGSHTIHGQVNFIKYLGINFDLFIFQDYSGY
ncbi:hypothetical protein L1887_38955 [Cichorium endivia]|nr:hypothetical protein L1887_38955 [Cichorium endivia]